MQDCIYAALHVLGIIIVWSVAIAVALAATGPSAGLVVAGALLAAGVITTFMVRSFTRAYNRVAPGALEAVSV